MASDYPYALATNRIKPLFKKITETGIPNKVDSKWLQQVGFPTTNDTRLLSILQHLGFIDASKAPTKLWRDYRGGNGAVQLGHAIKAAYSQLFHTYPKADQLSNAELSQYIRSNTALSTSTVTKAVTTFKELVALAEFTDQGSQPKADQPEDPIEEPPKVMIPIDRAS